MQHKFAIISLFLFTLCVLVGCREDVDLNNIDAHAELEMGLALPIGEMSASLGDFIGVNTLDGLYTDENGVFVYEGTFDMDPKRFHDIDLTSYVIKNKTTLEMKVQDKLGGLPFVEGNGHTQVALEFPYQLSLSGINDDTSTERLDSMLITSAKFHANLNVSGFDLQWSEIDKVALVLGDQFTREAGDTLWIPLSNYGYTQNIPIEVDNFSLNLLKDRNNIQGGSVQQIDMKMLFFFTVANGHRIILTENSGFTFNLNIELLKYKALWGFFEAGNQMRDVDTLSLDEMIGPMWQTLKNLKLRFAEPELTLTLTHKIAAPLICHLGSLQTINAQTGAYAIATWNGETEHDFPLTNILDPISSALTDSVANNAHFSYLESEGHLDQLFDVRPDSLRYAFGLRVDHDQLIRYPQFRITDDLNIRAKAKIKVPFVFYENSSIGIDTVFTGIDLSAASLDSLCQNIDVLDSVKTADLKLYIGVQNSLPFALKVSLHFLDEAGNEVPMDLGCGDTLLINGPSKEQIHNKVVTEPALTNVCVRLSKNEWHAFAQIKQIRMVAELCDNKDTVQLDKSQRITLRMGLSAKADAILDLGSLFNNSEK